MTSPHTQTQTLSSCVQIGCGGVAVHELACMRACVRCVCEGDGRFMASSAARSLSTCMATANPFKQCGCQQTRAHASATAGSAIRPYKIEHEDL